MVCGLMMHDTSMGILSIPDLPCDSRRFSGILFLWLTRLCCTLVQELLSVTVVCWSATETRCH